ncbi:HAD family hydrolase [Paraburkholderia fungorum]|jgi:P-type E1-E2 ATPase|uniref:HAD family hydrolase n=1 Tax=Paraburkholderia fungorum TaxID=134537 RepID=UPI00402B4D8E
MIRLEIPGFGGLALSHLVLDYNGTLAVDGHVLEGVHEELAAIAAHLDIHVVTGNSHGDVETRLSGWNVQLTCLPALGQAQAKRSYVEKLGANRTVAIGNGRNDAPMLKAAALGIAVLGSEGLAIDAVRDADILVRHVVDGIGLLLHPTRLIASLRA